MPAYSEGLGKNEIIGGCCIPEEEYEYGFRCPVGGDEFFLSKDGKLISTEDID